jgi:hypothetical protein
MATTLRTCFSSLPPEFVELIGKERRRRRQLRGADESIKQLDWVDPMVICTQCFTELPRECFSATQLQRGKNRCLACVGTFSNSLVEAPARLGEIRVTCRQCLTRLPEPFFSAAQLAHGQVCMPCIGSMSRQCIPHGTSCTDVTYPVNSADHDNDGISLEDEEGNSAASACDDYRHQVFALPEEASEVLVVNSPTNGAYKALCYDACTAQLVAIDAEWKPDKLGSDNPVAVLQLAFPTSLRVYVIQVRRLRGVLPNAVRKLLLNPMVQKVGFAVDAYDRAKFHRSGIMVSPISFGDMQECCAAILNFPDKSMCGLQQASEQLLGFYGMTKDKRLSCSDWDAMELTQEQVRYAALDAWVTLRLFFELELQVKQC